MFGIQQNKLIENLGNIAHKLCSYSMESHRTSRCDCKYGATYKKAAMCSEDGCGCPEVSMAEQIVKAMTPTEFKRICKRANISV